MSLAWLQRALCFLLIVAACAAHAVTPLSPRLSRGSWTELMAALERARFPEAGRNSVVLAATAVLGFKPAADAYANDPSYPQLPSVRASATPLDAHCARIVVHARYVQPRPHGVRVTGTYCMQAVGEWHAKSAPTLAEE